MKAIVTKYLPATTCKGSRIKASAEGVPSVIISYSHSGNEHREAALELCKRVKWPTDLISGGMPDQSGECFVFAPVQAELYQALGVLTRFILSGEHYESKNPNGRNPVIQALRALQSHNGVPNWMDAADSF